MKSVFVESLKRLYDARMIDETKVIELCKDGKIAEVDKKYILNNEN